MMKPLIMITNDDGVYSPGLAAAARAASKIGNILIAAPITQQTAMGRAFPRTSDLGIIEEIYLDISENNETPKVVKAYGVHGSPGYVAAYGIAEIAARLGKKVDLTVSGINYGCNLGGSITCSGTIGAALESASLGVKTLAMSLETAADITRSADYISLDFKSSEASTLFWLQKIFDDGMPNDCDILNVNLPYGFIEPESFSWTFMDRHNYYELVTPDPMRDWSQPSPMRYEIQTDKQNLKKGSDTYVVYQDRLTSVTPLTMDMTKYGTPL